MKKAGTPTMGGLLIIISIVVSTLLWANLRNPYVWIALSGLVSFGAIGFYDDYTKVSEDAEPGPDGAHEAPAAGAGGAGDRRLLLLLHDAECLFDRI